MSALRPPSDYHIRKADEAREFLMTLDDATQWIEFLDGLNLPWLVIGVTLIVVAGGVAKVWIKRR